MANYREQIGVHVASTVKTWLEFMDKQRLRWASFNLGPTPSDDKTSAEVGLIMEILEDRGYKVQLHPNVVQLMPVNTPNGQVTIPVCVYVFTLRAPEVQRVTLA